MVGLVTQIALLRVGGAQSLPESLVEQKAEAALAGDTCVFLPRLLLGLGLLL